VFSNHETKDPGPEPGSDDEAEEAEDSPVPMESVMGTAEVCCVLTKTSADAEIRPLAARVCCAFVVAVYAGSLRCEIRCRQQSNWQLRWSRNTDPDLLSC
jgi:hypothetical protein